MKKFMLLMLACMIVVPSVATIASAQIDADGWILNWLLLGPIPWTDIHSRLNVNQLAVDKQDKLLNSTTAEPLIRNNPILKPTEGQKGTGLAKDLAWTLQKDPDKNIDLNAIYGAPPEAVGKTEQVAAYAHTSVNSPKDQTVQVRTGSDDSLIVWINTVQIINQGHYRGGADDQDITPGVKLHAGWNSVLLKVVEQGGGWNFRLRFTDDAGKPIAGLTINPNFQGMPTFAVPGSTKGIVSVSNVDKLAITWGFMKRKF
jgi:hypothetical protein